jgi:hypothetical protein
MFDNAQAQPPRRSKTMFVDEFNGLLKTVLMQRMQGSPSVNLPASDAIHDVKPNAGA